MRLPRLVVLGLLILGVPLQGFAGVQYVDAACPMMEAAAMEGMEGMEGMSATEMSDMMAAMDCHTNEGETTKPGKPCPHGNSCQSLGPALLCEFHSPIHRSVAQPAPPWVAAPFESHDSMLLWRPPARI